MMRKTGIGWVTLALFLTFFAGAAQAGIIAVTTPTEFQAALDTAAANNMEHYTINVAEGVYDLTSTLIYAPFDFTQGHLTITGAGKGLTILDGGWDGATATGVQCLKIQTSLASNFPNVNVEGITFRNCYNDTDHGGGLRIQSKKGPVVVQDCDFFSNKSAAQYGGGAALSCSMGSIQVDRCDFRNNEAFYGGGGAHIISGAQSWVRNSVFAGNVAQQGGGLSLNLMAGSFSLIHVTATGNTATTGAGGGGGVNITGYASVTGGTLIIDNSVIYGNTGATGADVQSWLTADNTYISYTLYGDSYIWPDGTTLTETANVTDAPPQFADVTPADAMDWDVSLLATSPVVDYGDDTIANFPETDINGLTRSLDTNSDGVALPESGAYETRSPDAQALVTPTEYDYGAYSDGRQLGWGFKVENTGTADLTVGSITLTGTDPSDFNIDTNVSPVGCDGMAPVPSGDFCQFIVYFKPYGEGPKTATAEVATNDPVTPTVPISLTGEGLGPALTPDPVALDFGDIAEGDLSDPLTVTITNSLGGSVNTYGPCTIEGDDAAEFELVEGDCDTPNSTLPPLGTCTTEVQLAPTTLGLKTATLHLLNSQGETVVTLAGNGVEQPPKKKSGGSSGGCFLDALGE